VPVLRDDVGSFLAGAGPCSGERLDVQKVILEMDSQVAVSKIGNEQRGFSATRQLVGEVKELLYSFLEFRVAWVRRSGV
jgi:hypothetical protein